MEPVKVVFNKSITYDLMPGNFIPRTLYVGDEIAFPELNVSYVVDKPGVYIYQPQHDSILLTAKPKIERVGI